MSEAIPHQSVPDKRESRRQSLLDAVESVRGTVESGIDQAEREGTLPLFVVEAMQDAGLFRLKLPAELGGADADPVTQIDVIEAMSRIYPSAGWVLMTNATAIGNAGAFLSDEAVEQVFAGGQVPRAATVGGSTSKIELTSGGFVLNGRWPFCSGVPHADWICLGARLYGEPNTPPDVYTCFVPTSSVQNSRQLAGRWAQRFRQQRCLRIEPVRSSRLCLEKHHPPLRGIRRRGGPIFLLGLPGSVSNEHASFALGVGQKALDLIKEVAQSKRRGRGAASLLLTERPAFQRFVAEGGMRLHAAGLLTRDVHERAWQSVCAGVTPSADLEAEMRASAVLCTNVAVDVATQAFRFAGGSALHLEDRLQMCWRDINAGAQHFAVSDVAFENLGQYILGLPEANAYY